MSRQFDLNGGGEPVISGAGFNAGDGIGSVEDGASVDSGDAFGGTSFGDGHADPRGGDYVFDADRHVGRHSTLKDGSYRRKKAKRGSGGSNATRNTKADLSASVDALTKTLLIMHVGMAEMTKTPELALSEVEASGLATSAVNVLDQFDITPDPKMQAIVGLLMTAGMIYGPRMYNIQSRVKAEKSEPKSSASMHVLRPVDLTGNMPQDGTI